MKVVQIETSQGDETIIMKLSNSAYNLLAWLGKENFLSEDIECMVLNTNIYHFEDFTNEE
jgi:predicted small integral membrane protein